MWCMLQNEFYKLFKRLFSWYNVFNVLNNMFDVTDGGGGDSSSISGFAIVK